MVRGGGSLKHAGPTLQHMQRPQGGWSDGIIKNRNKAAVVTVKRVTTESRATGLVLITKAMERI
jgi:hypothetical protein